MEPIPVFINRKKQNQKGFTILELIIATSVFSVILLIITTGIITIGRTYYKGLTAARTQEAARSLVEDVSNAAQLGGNTQLTGNGFVPNPASKGPYAICVGNVRYSYYLDSKRGAAATPTAKHAMWMDIKNQTAPCTPVDLSQDFPSDPATTDIGQKQQAREMLPNNMRITQFNVTLEPGSVYKVQVRLFYGDDDLIDKSSSATDPSQWRCVQNNLGGQFCSFSYLENSIKKRL